MIPPSPDWTAIIEAIGDMDEPDARLGLSLRKQLLEFHRAAQTEAAFSNWNETLFSLESALIEGSSAQTLRELQADCVAATRELREVAIGWMSRPSIEANGSTSYH